jgi:hypothetical protein
MLPTQPVTKNISEMNTTEHIGVAISPFGLIPTSPKTLELRARHQAAHVCLTADKSDKIATES